VKIGFKFQSVGKISNILASTPPSSFRSIPKHGNEADLCLSQMLHTQPARKHNQLFDNFDFNCYMRKYNRMFYPYTQFTVMYLSVTTCRLAVLNDALTIWTSNSLDYHGQP